MLAYIRLLLFTGCRVSEILTLRWDDVAYTSRKLRLRDMKLKSGQNCVCAGYDALSSVRAWTGVRNDNEPLFVRIAKHPALIDRAIRS